MHRSRELLELYSAGHDGTKYIFGHMYIRRRESISGRPLKAQLFNFATHGIVLGHEAQMQTLLEPQPARVARRSAMHEVT